MNYAIEVNHLLINIKQKELLFIDFSHDLTISNDVSLSLYIIKRIRIGKSIEGRFVYLYLLFIFSRIMIR
jgi:hypothetical protein